MLVARIGVPNPCRREPRRVSHRRISNLSLNARILRMALGIAAAATLPGCGGSGSATVTSAPAPAVQPTLTFTDITESAGIKFIHVSGGYGKKLLLEPMGAGCAFLDYDRDGWLDILLVNGGLFPRSKKVPAPTMLYHNNGDSTFTDVTAASGLKVTTYAMGVAVGDYDGDAWPDIYISGYDHGQLFRNAGQGTFAEVTAAAGVANQGHWGTSALWFDYDRDGGLDLLIGNYVEYSISLDEKLFERFARPSYGDPVNYPSEHLTLYRNRGNGTFESASAKAGLAEIPVKALGLAMFDFDDDGWPDVAVASDQVPNSLLHNQQDGTFAEMGKTAQIAFSREGKARAGMGIDTGDLDHSGREAVAVTNYQYERTALFAPAAGGAFKDEADTAGIGAPTHQLLGWGIRLLDIDNDGWKDLVQVNGHFMEDVAKYHLQGTWEMPGVLLWNRHDRTFADVTGAVAPPFITPRPYRGLAAGDFDNDGDFDLLVTLNGTLRTQQSAFLLRNDGGNARRWIRFVLVGDGKNPMALGARVRVTAGGFTQQDWVRGASSYLSQSDSRPLFGLGGETRVERVDIRWPDGSAGPPLERLETNRTYVVQKGKGTITVVEPGQPVPWPTAESPPH